MGKIGEACT